MKHFNLSSWAVSHPTLILFLMIVLGAAGFFSYERLGRAEDHLRQLRRLVQRHPPREALEVMRLQLQRHHAPLDAGMLGSIRRALAQPPENIFQQARIRYVLVERRL